MPSRIIASWAWSTATLRTPLDASGSWNEPGAAGPPSTWLAAILGAGMEEGGTSGDQVALYPLTDAPEARHA